MIFEKRRYFLLCVLIAFLLIIRLPQVTLSYFKPAQSQSVSALYLQNQSENKSKFLPEIEGHWAQPSIKAISDKDIIG